MGAALASVLLLSLSLPGATLAQAEPEASTAPAASAESPSAATTFKPGRFRPADVPRGEVGVEVRDVVAGGPGLVAVGGGSGNGIDLKALIWVSEDGRRWQSVPLFGDAANGLIEAVTQAPDGSFVAVGRELLVNDGLPEVNALVWRSADGISWTRIPAAESFSRSLMFDVAGTVDGVVAVGCQAGGECGTGRVWRSSDGLDWQLAAELQMIPQAVVAGGSTIVVAGSEEFGVGSTGQAVVSSSADGITWSTPAPLAERESLLGDVTLHGEQLVATGSLRTSDGEGDRGLLYTSADGEAWQPVASPRLERDVVPTAVVSSGEIVLVLGGRFSANGEKPVVLWGDDLAALKTGKPPAKGTGDGYALAGGGASADGGMVFMLGRDQRYRPAIWYSEIR